MRRSTRYSHFFINELRARADLVQVVQQYTELKKKGSSWMGCCPFHQEKTPSFSVNRSKGFYKCFGCGKGGSVFTFVMEMEGVSFPKAVERVAEITGTDAPVVTVTRGPTAKKERSPEEIEMAHQIVEMNLAAMKFWTGRLWSAGGEAARDYLRGRGLTQKMAEHFQIGFAPNSWDSLLTVLRDAGADEQLIKLSGLVSVNEEKGRIYDRFRGRIVFPVLDSDGRPIAFGARALGDEDPRYLNSPETLAYVKGQHLYGLHDSKGSIAKLGFAVLVEGYTDLIALRQHGICNVVAGLGTALTPGQVELLGRFTKRVVVNYDGDEAGIKAALRAVDLLEPDGFEVKVLELPEGKDPDDFVRQFGADAYNKLRGGAIRAAEWVTTIGDKYGS